MDRDHRLTALEHDLLASLFIHVSLAAQRLGLVLSDAQRRKLAGEYLAWLDRGWARTDASALEFTPGRLVERAEALDRVHRVSGRVKAVEKAFTHRVPAKSGPPTYRYGTAVVVTVEADDGTELRTLPIVDRALIDFLTAPSTVGATLELTLLAMAVPDAPHGAERPFAAFVIAARSAEIPVAMIDATQKEIAAGEKTLALLARKRIAPWLWIYERAIELLGVVGMSENPELEIALQAVVLAVLSWGHLDARTARISLLIVSDPAQGKHFARELAERIALRFCAAVAANLSVAGLSGQRPGAVARAKGTHAAPLLRRGQRGTFCVEDANAIPRRNSEGVFAVFQKLMDTGRVESGAARGESFDANCALVLDTNWPDNLGVALGRAPNVAFVPEHRPVATRLDTIVCLRADLARSLATAAKARVAMQGSTHSDEWRALRILVALLVQRHASVIVDGGVQREIDRGMARLAKQLETLGVPHANEHLPRMRVAYTRFVIAIARGCGRGKCRVADAKAAEPFLVAKVNALSEVAKRRERNVAARDAAKQNLRRTTRGADTEEDEKAAALARALGTSARTFGEIHQRFEAALGRKLHRTNVHKLLRSSAIPVEHGRWRAK